MVDAPSYSDGGGGIAPDGAGLFEEARARANAPLQMLAVLPSIGRQLHVSRRQALGREMWAVAQEDCWAGMVMELRRLSDDLTVMTWDGEVVMFGPDLVLRPLPETTTGETADTSVSKLTLYLVEQDAASQALLTLDRAVVRATSREEACAIAAEWLKEEADRRAADIADLDGLFALELGAADPNDEACEVVVARPKD